MFVVGNYFHILLKHNPVVATALANLDTTCPAQRADQGLEIGEWIVEHNEDTIIPGDWKAESWEMLAALLVAKGGFLPARIYVEILLDRLMSSGAWTTASCGVTPQQGVAVGFATNVSTKIFEFEDLFVEFYEFEYV